MESHGETQVVQVNGDGDLELRSVSSHLAESRVETAELGDRFPAAGLERRSKWSVLLNTDIRHCFLHCF